MTYLQKTYKTLLSSDKKMISDHKVMGRFVVPAAVYLSMIIIPIIDRKYFEGIELRDVNIANPIIVKDDIDIPVSVYLEDDDSILKFKVMSVENEKSNIHALGKVGYITMDKEESLVLEEIKARCIYIMDKGEFYNRYRECGILYGQYYRTVEEIKINSFEFMSKIQPSNDSEYCLNPSVIDGAIQSVGAIYKGSPENIYLPSFIKKIQVYKFPKGINYCYGISYYDSSKNPDKLMYDIIICDENGSVLVKFSQFEMKRFKNNK